MKLLRSSVVTVIQALWWTAFLKEYGVGCLKSPFPLCGQSEEWRVCGPRCPLSCDTLSTQICCDAECTKGCFCQDGYLLLSNIGPRKCVPLDQCPKPGTLEFEKLTVTVVENMKVVLLTVLRIGGSAGELTVQWRTIEGTANAGSDFEQSIGILVFPDSVTFKVIQITIIDDNQKENDETFTVELFNATDKADINARKAGGVAVIIKDDDMQPGLIELQNVSITVPENRDIVSVSLIRVDGVDGLIRMKYKTVDGTARGGLDFVTATGLISFDEGERIKTVSLSILNDDVAEPPESFQLQFFEPSAAEGVINFRQLSTTSFVSTITILDDDAKPGYVQLAAPVITVPETVGSLRILIMRIGGRDGEIRVRYGTADITARTPSDYIAVSGEVIFKDGETLKPIAIRIVNDQVAEPTESFRLELFDVSAGPDAINFKPIRSQLSTIVSIIDDDRKPGFVDLEKLSVSVQESAGTVILNVLRQGGMDDLLRLGYKTVNGTAVSGLDFLPVSGNLAFGSGESIKSITIPIVDDAIKEDDETFAVELYEVSLSGLETVNLRVLGSRLKTVITIVDDDDILSYLEMKLLEITVLESKGSVDIPVLRLGGSDGQLRAMYKTVAGTAVAGQDFEPASGEIIFGNGETLKTLSVKIVDDAVRENIETFQVQIINPAVAGQAGFRAVGAKMTTVVSIIDNDVSPGVFAFEIARVTVVESDRSVSLNLIRTQGSDGEVKVELRSHGSSATESVDYVPPPRDIIFGEGELKRSIQIQIIDDNLREGTEEFKVRIFNPTKGGIIGPIAMVTVVIIDDDTPSPHSLPPYGIQVAFTLLSIRVLENAGAVFIPILRTAGTGAYTVNIRTIDGTAIGDQDYRRTRGPIYFKEDDLQLTFGVRLIDDRIYEGDETFSVELYGLSSGTIVTGRSIVVITIVDDDGPFYARISGNATVQGMKVGGSASVGYASDRSSSHSTQTPKTSIPPILSYR